MTNPASNFGNQWTIAQGTWHNGLPIIMRLRTEIDDHVGSPDYAIGYRITWKFANPTKDGYPSESDRDLMDAFELKLIKEFESSSTAIVVAVVTHNGERDFICYTGDPNSAHTLFNKTFAADPARPLSFAAAADPEWQEYIGMRAQVADD
ncbi:MAG: DUF695 domain-containing protein [Planctomycetota bacterium]